MTPEKFKQLLKEFAPKKEIQEAPGTAKEKALSIIGTRMKMASNPASAQKAKAALQTITDMPDDKMFWDSFFSLVLILTN